VRDHFETFRAHAASLRDGEGASAICRVRAISRLAERSFSALPHDSIGRVPRGNRLEIAVIERLLEHDVDTIGRGSH
jgi:hypothetical protein